MQSNSICPKITKKKIRDIAILKLKISYRCERKYERHNMSDSDDCVQGQSTRTSNIRVPDQLIYLPIAGRRLRDVWNFCHGCCRSHLDPDPTKQKAGNRRRLFSLCLHVSYCLIRLAHCIHTHTFSGGGHRTEPTPSIINFQINSSASLAPKSNLFQSCSHVDCHLLN